jgi:hypothetical protein
MSRKILSKNGVPKRLDGPAIICPNAKIDASSSRCRKIGVFFFVFSVLPKLCFAFHSDDGKVRHFNSATLPSEYSWKHLEAGHIQVSLVVQ